MWLQEFSMDLEDLDYVLGNLASWLKGTTDIGQFSGTFDRDQETMVR